MTSSSKALIELAPNPRVLVVGAGFAGVAAAEALREGGVEEVLVLEAQDRPGGRVQKIELEGGFAEPGAQFIHGEKGNKLFDLAKQYGLLMDASLYQDAKKTKDSSAADYEDHHFVTSRGERLDRDSVARLIRVVNKVFRNYANSFFVDAALNEETDTQNRESNTLNEESNTADAKTKTLNRERNTMNAESNTLNAQMTQNGECSDPNAKSNMLNAQSNTLNATSNTLNAQSNTLKQQDGGQNATKRDNMTAEVTTLTQNGTAQNEENSAAEEKQKKLSNQNGVTMKSASTAFGDNCFIINYSGAVLDEAGNSKQRPSTFVDVLKKAREQILALAGNEPEEIKIAILKWMEQWEYTDNGARLPELSLQAYGKYAYLEGYGLTLTSSGLEDVHRTFLARSLPPHDLLLGKAVKNIYWAELPSSDSLAGQPSSDRRAERPSLDSLAKRPSSDNLAERPSSDRLVERPSSDSLAGQPSSDRRAELPSLDSLAERPSSDSLAERPSSDSLAERPSSDQLAERPAKDHECQNEHNGEVSRNEVVGSRCSDYEADRSYQPSREKRNTDVLNSKPEVTETLKMNGTVHSPHGSKRCLPSQQKSSEKSKPVRVVCEDGEEFLADHVIVTSSIGYLKQHEATMFKPQLPEKVLQAIHHMGFSTVAKVFLVWDDLHEVLDPEVEGIQFLWLGSCPLLPPSDRTARKTKTGGSWYDMLQGFERVPSHKGMLLTWLAGEEADIMEELPEREVKDVLYELLVQFTNNKNLPRPKQIVRSQWHSNPYILGGYSYIPADMDPESHNLLSEPLPSKQNPVLQLSGEATSPRFYSAVHGAIDSGQRAARAILRHYKLTS